MPEDNIDKIIGARLREARLKRNMSQKALGDVLGVSFQQIQKYESGQNKISVSRYIEICKFFGKNLLRFSNEEVEILQKTKDFLQSREFKNLIDIAKKYELYTSNLKTENSTEE
jgi:transcriptional regulator with XRE-family HTH domain